ncbi:hypothetical protein CEUSTIGMA_g6950.t1 [Chlamydomonas eustigma]|uniref:Uncharacterized protein n=1 Tax=Chlamydomonas eustigma TaxID=1157962 RepID=A0A250X9C9_9CHLO|nr:hypothetical protein CEUSTIGMA_g6950.t1 [Chlamydomonas eustigma]|eukprot:GAX79509.1 hypothetical protein CEUSTIGMA_g6950.t1 [Chlamydomonas eustigma]
MTDDRERFIQGALTKLPSTGSQNFSCIQRNGQKATLCLMKPIRSIPVRVDPEALAFVSDDEGPFIRDIKKTVIRMAAPGPHHASTSKPYAEPKTAVPSNKDTSGGSKRSGVAGRNEEAPPMKKTNR